MAINYDSEALRRIRRDLTPDDLEFVRSFEAEASPPPSAPDENSDRSLVWISAFISASILALRSLTVSARQRLTTVGEVVLDGLLSGVAAVVAVVFVGAAALAVAVLLLEWWF